jgi:hypothetical protein
MDNSDVLKLLSAAFQIGYAQAKIDHGDGKPYLNFSEAADKYGEKVLKRWIKEGLIVTIRDNVKNGNIRIDNVKLRLVAASNNLYCLCFIYEEIIHIINYFML